MNGRREWTPMERLRIDLEAICRRLTNILNKSEGVNFDVAPLPRRPDHVARTTRPRSQETPYGFR